MTEVSRRSFLKGAAALGAMTAATGMVATPLVASAADDAPKGKVEVKHMWCQMCGISETYCGTLCTVEDGVFTHVEGNPLAGNNYEHGGRTLCAKGNCAPQLVYDPSRILYPMKLVGEKGSGKFERITWDEAMQTIADKLKKNAEEYGPETFFILSGQSAEVVDVLGMRFLNLYGSPNWCHNGICWDQRETTKACTIGGASTFPGQIDKTKLLVCWGHNKENTGVNQTRGQNNNRLTERDRGMVTIDIRPMLNTLGAHSDIWVPIRPGTDGALALAILNVIIGEDLYDHDFCDKWVNGFDKLVEHVKQFTPEWAANITGLPVEQIYQIARMMGTMKPMALMDGNGFGDQTNDGTWTAVSIFLIQAITGNLDIAGGNGAGLIYPDPMFEISDMTWFLSSMHKFDKLEETEEDKAHGWPAGTSKLLAPEFPRDFYKDFCYSLSSCNPRVIEMIDSDHPKKPRVLFSHATNSLSALRQPKRMKECLAKCDFHFTMDTNWNPTCDYCDIVLPACTAYETQDQLHIVNRLQGTFLGINHKLIEPLGESRSDWSFYADLACRMGYADDWWGGEVDGQLRELLEGSGITLEELRKPEYDKGYFVERPAAEQVMREPKYQRYEELFSKLPNNKVQAYHELFGGKVDNTDNGTLGYLPEYVGAPESLAGTPEIAKEYPLIFSDVHGHRLAEHSHRNNLPWCREIEPYPWCKLNPETGAKYGIADGDWMRVESPHGWVVLKAKYFEGISPEVLMARRGWWQDCQGLDLPGYGFEDGGSECNVLYDSNPANWDKFSSASAKQTLVKISKFEGKIEPLAVSENILSKQQPELLDAFKTGGLINV